jgi:hypothetical protein
MIHTLLDARHFILENQGEPQSCYCLAPQAMAMKPARASVADLRDTRER